MTFKKKHNNYISDSLIDTERLIYGSYQFTNIYYSILILDFENSSLINLPGGLNRWQY
jgi:hypothetical protein